jgi:hypothetical protein
MSEISIPTTLSTPSIITTVAVRKGSSIKRYRNGVDRVGRLRTTETVTIPDSRKGSKYPIVLLNGFNAIRTKKSTSIVAR